MAKKQTNYRRGREIEYKRIKWHKEQGATIAQRSAGSHSDIDLFAIYVGDRTIFLEQIKRSKKGHLEKVIPPIPDGLYKVQFRVMHWVDGKGFVEGDKANWGVFFDNKEHK